MAPVDGTSPLAARRDYLRRRRGGRLGARGVVAVWGGLAALCLWLLLVGMFDVVH